MGILGAKIHSQIQHDQFLSCKNSLGDLTYACDSSLWNIDVITTHRGFRDNRSDSFLDLSNLPAHSQSDQSYRFRQSDMFYRSLGRLSLEFLHGQAGSYLLLKWKSAS